MADRGGVRRKPYWVALRIFGTAIANWGEINGECIYRGIKPLKLSPSDFCDLILYFVTRNMDQKEQDAFGRKLYLPPRGVEPDDDLPYWGLNAEIEAFNRSAPGGEKL